MDKWGNAKANIYWEAHLKPGHVVPEHKMESFIRSKYESKRWAMEGPLPDPATLGATPSEAPAQPAVEQQQQAKSVASPSTQRQQKQPTAIDLLGGAFGDAPSSSSTKAAPSLGFPGAPSNRASPAPAAASRQAAPAPAASSNGGGLFDLDFNAAPSNSNAVTSTSETAGSGRKNNADILSLFGAPAAPARPAAATSSASTSGAFDAFASMNLGAPSSNNGFSSYTSSTPAQQPAQAQQQYTRPASNSISNPWGEPASSSSTGTTAPSMSSNLFASPSASSQAPPYYAPTSTNAFTSPPAQQQPAPVASTNSNGLDFFNSQDIWGAPTQASAQNNGSSTKTNDAFGGWSSGTGGTSKNGGFDDLWS